MNRLLIKVLDNLGRFDQELRAPTRAGGRLPRGMEWMHQDGRLS